MKLCLAFLCLCITRLMLAVTDECVDNPWFEKVNGKCQDIIMMAHKQCYYYDNFCCATCAQVAQLYKHLPDCRYGDRINDCSTLDKVQCYAGKNADICCSRCKAFETGIAGCKYGDKNPSWCPQIPRGYCYNAGVHDICCATCPTHATGPEGCKYGDKNPSWCLQIPTGYCYDAEVRDICCATCPPHATGPEGCEYGDMAEWCTTLAAGDCYLNNAVCCDKCRQYETNDPGCLYGADKYNCTGMHAGWCYSPDFRDQCCGSCKTYHNETGPQGCEYGDWSSGCKPALCDHYANATETCCKTCAKIV